MAADWYNKLFGYRRASNNYFAKILFLYVVPVIFEYCDHLLNGFGNARVFRNRIAVVMSPGELIGLVVILAWT